MIPRAARVALAALLAVSSAARSQVAPAAPNDADLFKSVDALARVLVDRHGVVNDSLYSAVQDFLNSDRGKTFVKVTPEVAWLNAVTRRTNDATRPRLLRDLPDTIDIDLTLSLQTTADPTSQRNLCKLPESPNRVTVSERTTWYVSQEIDAVCDALKKVTDRTPDSTEWRRRDTVSLLEQKVSSFQPVVMSVAGPLRPDSSCYRNDIRHGNDNRISIKAAQNIQRGLRDLCKLVANVAANHDRSLNVNAALTMLPRRALADTMEKLQTQLVSLSLVVEVLKYQVWRRSMAAEMVCRSYEAYVKSTNVPTFGWLAAVDTKGGLGGDLVFPTSSASVLTGGRKIPGHSGGVVEVGGGGEIGWPRTTKKVPAFGTVFYDTDAKHAGISLMVTPITWRQSRVGFGVASDGTVSLKFGMPLPKRIHETTSSSVLSTACQGATTWRTSAKPIR